MCESRIHNSNSIKIQSLNFTQFESEQIMRKAHRFSFRFKTVTLRGLALEFSAIKQISPSQKFN